MMVSGRLALLCAALLARGCGPSADDPLPSEDDLYAYSLAVATRAKLLVPEGRWRAIYNIGKVHHRFGLEDAALETFAEAIRLARDSAADAYRDTGSILSQKNRMAEAVDAYERALQCGSKQPGIYTRIGMICLHQGRIEDAIASFKREEDQGTADGVTWYQLGQACQLADDPAKAVEYYRKAPEMREALYGLYKSLQSLGRDEEAAAALKRFEEKKAEVARAELDSDRERRKTNRKEQLRATAATWEDSGYLFLEERSAAADPEAAERYLGRAIHATREALRFDPTREEPYQFLSEHYLSRKKKAEALEILRRATEHVPANPTFHLRLAMLLLHLSDPARAKEQGTSAAGTSDPVVENGVAEARAHLQKAVEIAPKFAEAHYRLAQLLLFRSGRREDLPAALEHALAAVDHAEKPSPRYEDLLAFAFHSSGRRREARLTLRKAVERFPGDAPLKGRLAEYEKQFPEGSTP